ncbi:MULTISPECIES: hypothetical protein [Prochlorococcus]|uniref:hypothetical protein n=1 Tax=Prochlorococcus TaxID=1218 RepID=UPI000533AE42|nr:MULTISPECIES: hypothetical protein [Prochlorococcus]KGG11985.1 putative 4Fe-4S iron sulfur cluster binding pr [Prochlorococcus sp. MIT 0601]
MILIKITNSSELIATKVGQLIERFTPDGIDETLVEEAIIKQMIKTLSEEGVKGEISLVNGLEVENEKLVLKNSFAVNQLSLF